jgi:hypothetical protein
VKETPVDALGFGAMNAMLEMTQFRFSFSPLDSLPSIFA